MYPLSVKQTYLAVFMLCKLRCFAWFGNHDDIGLHDDISPTKLPQRQVFRANFLTEAEG